MSGTRLQKYLNIEYDRLYRSVDAFRMLLPHPAKDASIHSGEEGRFLEELFKEFIRRRVPTVCGVGSGFVACLEREFTSYQTDILIYDRSRYSPVLEYGDAVIIPHQSLIAALSIKRTITYSQIADETRSLSTIGSLCGTAFSRRYPPYLAIVALGHSSPNANFEEKIQSSHEKMLSVYSQRECGWSMNELVNDLIIVDDFLIHRAAVRARDAASAPKTAAFTWTGGNGANRHLYLQHILKGIGDVLERMFGVANPIPVEMPQGGRRKLRGIPICTVNRPMPKEVRAAFADRVPLTLSADAASAPK